MGYYNFSSEGKHNTLKLIASDLDRQKRYETRAKRGTVFGPRKQWEDLISQREYTFKEAYEIFCERFPTYREEKFKNMLLEWSFELNEKNEKEKDVNGSER